MKNIKKRGMVVALAGVMAASIVGMAACGDGKGNNELWITYFSGGYGDEWVEQLARKFEAENEGVTVKTNPDTQLINAVPNMMKNGTDYDLIFCHDIAWEDFVQPGYIYCLDDLYKTEVSTGVTFADRIWDEDVLDSCSYRTSDGQDHYYKVPWTIGTAGIAYSLTVMDRIDGWLASAEGQAYLQTSEGGNRATSFRWDRKAPVSYYDLWQYCLDVTKADLSVTEGNSKSGTIVPFTWSGQAEEWQWDYVVFDWWGQLAGPDTMNVYKNFNNVDANGRLDWDNYKNPSSDVFDPAKSALTNNGVGWKEFQDAYNLWYNLIVENKDWSDSKVGSYSKFSNEQAFAEGKAAMTPAACWIEYESKIYLENSHNEVSIMPTPTVANVKLDSNGKVILPNDTSKTAATTLDAIHAESGVTEKIVTIDGVNYNRVSFTSSFGDSAVIPQKASGKDLAVKFLLFMQEEENAKLFTKLSGGTVLPYKYEYWNSFVENGVDKASAWQKSIFEIDRNSTKFNNYTKHPMMRNTELRGSAVMTTIWPTNNYYYFKAWNENTNTSYAPSTLMSTLYSDVLAHWELYKRAI